MKIVICGAICGMVCGMVCGIVCEVVSIMMLWVSTPNVLLEFQNPCRCASVSRLMPFLWSRPIYRHAGPIRLPGAPTATTYNDQPSAYHQRITSREKL